MARQGVPRGPLTSFGKLLQERDISAKTIGEAIGIAEDKYPLPTGVVNYYVYGQLRPGPLRQRILSELLKVPVDELFPDGPVHPSKRKRSKQELQLLEDAKSVKPAAKRTKRAAAHIGR